MRLRPWSVLVRIPVEGLAEGPATVWLKANPPAGAFEAPLTAALARWVPEYVLEPLAVDADRGWSLLPHGGELFRQFLDRAPADPRAWEEPLRQYATMQRALIPHTKDLEQLGVPSARLTALPRSLRRDPAVHRGHGRTGRRSAQLHALRPLLRELCAELAELGIPDSLDHSDLHDGQFFHPAPGRTRSSTGVTPPSRTPSAVSWSRPDGSTNGTAPRHCPACGTPTWSPGREAATPPPNSAAP
ncbi:hypothetical protein ACRAWF_45280 [Streptomyces sp. L7]